MKTLIGLLFLLTVSHVEAQALKGELRVNGKVGQSMTSGQAARLRFDITETATGMPPHHFHEMHEKPMHLVIVPEDLSDFAHVHPEIKGHHHQYFELKVNAPTNDSDNQDVPRAIRHSGRYFLFAEIMPMGQLMTTLAFDLESQGQPRALAPLVTDKTEADGYYWKYLKADSSPGTFGDAYQLRVMLEPFSHCGYWTPRFQIEVSTWNQGVYVPVMDLDTWLASYGHAIMVGQKGKLAAEKTIVHLHAVWPLPSDEENPDRGPWIDLAAHVHGTMEDDVYRAWIQFKHRSKVFTMPVTFPWQAPLKTQKSRAGCAR